MLLSNCRVFELFELTGVNSPAASIVIILITDERARKNVMKPQKNLLEP